MGSTKQFCLKWDSHQRNLLTGFDHLLQKGSLVDVTLACGGLRLKAHKVVLSACSPYFQELFVENPCQHPIVILKDIPYEEMKCLIEFMYKGEVNVSEDKLMALLKTAGFLQVKALTDIHQPLESLPVEKDVAPSMVLESTESDSPPPSPKSPKRKRLRTAPTSSELPAPDRGTSGSNDKMPSRPVVQPTSAPWPCPKAVASDADRQLYRPDVEEVKCEPVFALEPECCSDEEPCCDEHNGTGEMRNEAEDCVPGDLSESAGGEQLMADCDSTDYCFVKSQRGGQLLLRRGYVFKINKTGPKGRKYYRCYRDVETGCKARAIVWNEMLNDIGDHNHEPEQELTRRKYLLQNLNEANSSGNEILPLSSAFDEPQTSQDQRTDCEKIDPEDTVVCLIDKRARSSPSSKKTGLLSRLRCNT